ncbi:kynurenine formamidase [Catenulispora sp. MAP5-51]
MTSGFSSPGPGVHSAAGVGTLGEAAGDDGPPGVTVGDGAVEVAVGDGAGAGDAEPDAVAVAADVGEAGDADEAGDVGDVAPVVGELVAAPPALPCEESHAAAPSAAPSAAMPPRRIVRLVLIRFSIRQNPRGTAKEGAVARLTSRRAGSTVPGMTLLAQLAEAVAAGTIEVVDLTAPLSHETPILHLPEPFTNTVEFSLREISRYDERGPAWYWNDIVTGEHVGTHFDAPVHWITGRDGEDVSQVAPRRLIGPAVVLDASDRAASDPDHLLQVEDVQEWEAKHGPLPEGGWLLYRTGWDARAGDQAAFLNANETGPHSPGFSAECAKWLAEETPLRGIGVETVGTDAGAAHGFDPPFPCHSFMLGAGKYGLTQLRNLDRLPARGAVLIAAPLPIVRGSGSPARVLALVEREA